MKPTPGDVKAQGVRLADVYLIGPLMIWGGARAIPDNPVPGLLLTLFGMGTIVYNGVNYRKVQKEDAMIWPFIALLGGIGLLGTTRGKKTGGTFPPISFAQPPAYILNALKTASARYGVPLNILKGVAHTESRYNPSVTSHAGAKGLMQLMPSVIQTYGITNPFDPLQNALGGARWLSKLYRKYNNWPKAIAAYNWGPGNVDRKPRLPPQTQAYVKNVMGKAAAA